MNPNWRFSVLTYCAIAYAWSWSFWFVSTLARQQNSLVALLLGAIGSFGPFIAAVTLATWHSRRSGVWGLLRRGLEWRFGWRWYAVVLGLPALILWLSVGIHRAMGAAVPRFVVVNHWSLVPLSFLLNLILGGPLGEEFGWRGFLLPLFQSRFSALWASVSIGVIWACWHLPLFFIPDQLQQQFPFPLFLLNTIALSILFTWVYNGTGGSVLSAILLHTSVNYSSGVIPVLPEAVGSLRPYAIATLILWAIAVWVVWRAESFHSTSKQRFD